MVVLALRRPQPLPLAKKIAAPSPPRLADDVLPQHRRLAPGARATGKGATAQLAAGFWPNLAAGTRCLRHHGHRRRRAAEDLEQHAHRVEARAAGALAAAGAHGGAAEPDQSAFP